MQGLEVSTALGQFTVRLFTDRAPVTCRYFIDLCERGSLDDGRVFRILAPTNDALEMPPHIQVVQLGNQQGLGAPRERIAHESTALSGLAHRRWSVSASRFAPGEVYRSFFVCMRDEPVLDFGGTRQDDGLGYAAFGEISDGHDTLLALSARAETQPELDAPIPVHRVRVVSLTAPPTTQGPEQR
ncbi:MAG: peptidylprolyl isomerase [Pseudomonadota bacterium]